MVTTLIFLRNGWILLFWSVPLIELFGCRCNVLTNAAQSANVVTCAAVEIPPSSSLGNPGGSSSLIELAISRTICFISFFEPVAAMAFTHSSSVGVTTRYRAVRRCRPVQVIVFMHYVRIIILLPCPHVTFATSFLQNANGRYMRLHTLISYVLLTSINKHSKAVWRSLELKNFYLFHVLCTSLYGYLRQDALVSSSVRIGCNPLTTVTWPLNLRIISNNNYLPITSSSLVASYWQKPILCQ